VIRRFARPLAAALVALAGLLAAPRAEAANAVLAKDGTLYEVFVTNYGSVISGANASDSALPVVALRTTLPGQAPVVEIVGGSVTPLLKFGESLEVDDTTQTVFVVYTSLQVQGFFADVRAAMLRDGGWSEGGFLPNAGLYFSVNPKLLVTRQTYKTFDASGAPVTKTRSILSVVWWEETSLSQARYASLFIEDGSMRFSDVAAYNLNELAGAAGPTSAAGIPTSSYMFPAVQRDPASNGGVLVSFANLATRTQQVLRLGFTDDYTQPVATPAGPAATTSGRTASSRSTPIGRGISEFPLPRIDLPFLVTVGTIISPSMVPTYWWVRSGALNYQTGDATSLANPPLVIPIRPDFSVDRALSVVGSMAERQ
jgi:hypothetical protein